MKTNKKIMKEFWEAFVRDDGLMDKYMYDENGDTLTMAEAIEQFFSSALDKVREESMDEFFKAVDERYEDFEITKAMGKILQSLKSK